MTRITRATVMRQRTLNVDDRGADGGGAIGRDIMKVRAATNFSIAGSSALTASATR